MAGQTRKNQLKTGKRRSRESKGKNKNQSTKDRNQGMSTLSRFPFEDRKRVSEKKVCAVVVFAFIRPFLDIDQTSWPLSWHERTIAPLAQQREERRESNLWNEIEGESGEREGEKTKETNLKTILLPSGKKPDQVRISREERGFFFLFSSYNTPYSQLDCTRCCWKKLQGKH